MREFNYIKPENLKAYWKILKNDPAALPYAGGTDILGLLKDEIINPDNIADLKNIPEINFINYKKGKGIRIGSTVKLSDISENSIIKKKYGALAEAADSVASPQLRNMGTIGGNLCQRPRCWYFRGDFNCIRKGGSDCFAINGENKFHCILGGGPCFIVHPSDIATALIALNASVIIISGSKKTRIPLDKFFILPEEDPLKENIIKSGELIKEIFIPEPPSDLISRFLKFAERDVWDFATVNGAIAYSGSKKSIKEGRIVLGGVAPIPWLLHIKKNRGILEQKINIRWIEGLSEKMLKDSAPMDQNRYKVTMAKNMIKDLFS